MSTCRNTIYQSGALPDAPLDASSQVELSSAVEVWEDLTGDGALSRVTIGSLASVVDSVMFLQSRILYVGSQVTERTSTFELWSCFEVGAALPPMINTLPSSSVEIASGIGLYDVPFLYSNVEIASDVRMSDVQLPFLSSNTTVSSDVGMSDVQLSLLSSYTTVASNIPMLDAQLPFLSSSTTISSDIRIIGLSDVQLPFLSSNTTVSSDVGMSDVQLSLLSSYTTVSSDIGLSDVQLPLLSSNTTVSSDIGLSDVQLPFLSSSTTVGSSVLSLIPIPSIPRHEAFYLINSTTGAVSTIATDVTHIAAKDGALYASSGESLLAFTGSPASGYVVTGEIEFDSDRLTNVHELAANYSGTTVSATVIYDGVEFGPYESVMSDRQFKASRNAAAYSRAPQIRIDWPAGTNTIDGVDIYTTPHPRRRS